MRRFRLLLSGLVLAWAITSTAGQFTAGDQLSGAHVSYATAFAATENPLSEGGRWLSGLANGESWTNLRTTSGLGVWGTQADHAPPPYDDSFGLLRPPAGRVWGKDQDARCTVFIRNRGTWTNNHEVELLLRGHVAPGVARFYEVLFSTSSTNAYVEIVQWLGPLGNNGGGAAGNTHAFLSRAFVNDGIVLNDGDRVRATIGINASGVADGSQVIRLWRQQGAATTWTAYSISYDISGDANRYLSGLPGVGWFKNGTSNNDDYGCSSYQVDTWN